MRRVISARAIVQLALAATLILGTRPAGAQVVTRPVPPGDPVVDSVRNGPPLQNAGRVRVRVYFTGPTDADSIEVVTPRLDGMVVWATPRLGRFGGVWEAAWAQDRPPREGCVAQARAWLGAWSSSQIPVDWCPYVVSAVAGGASTPGQPPATGVPTGPPPGSNPPAGGAQPAAPSAPAATSNAPVAACHWRLTAGAPLSLTLTGNSATFMGIPPATMFMFGSSDPADRGAGTVTASGVSGTGSYPVGTATGNPPSGSVFTDGGSVGIGTGDGRSPAPPPSSLSVTAHSGTDIQGTVTGTFMLLSNVTVQAPVRVDFWARSASLGCP